MISAEIHEKRHLAQTTLLIAAALGAIVVDASCPMQVTAAGPQKAPSESARHPNTDVPYGGLQQRGGQEVGRVRGLLVR